MDVVVEEDVVEIDVVGLDVDVVALEIEVVLVTEVVVVVEGPTDVAKYAAMATTTNKTTTIRTTIARAMASLSRPICILCRCSPFPSLS